ncbi:toxin co-regulated pilus biosynthesis Q family protein [Salmonella enterica]|nr:toxin co-regulated pilus biosynthesis Q family protein [Salmonella enterica]ELJ4842977.1 toxin co-regulated pilus biosynthesis Q family protein [Salmonella enterica]
MKHYTVTAVGLLLSGCAVQGNNRPDIPADDVVDQMLAVNMQKVSFVQQQLIAALTPVLPASPTTASAAKHPASASASADIPVSAPHLPALTYTGQRQAIPALAAPGKAPTLHLALVKIIPDTWSIHFDMGLKPEVKRPLTWVGNDQWPYVLSRILVQEKLRAEVNWSAQKVSVSAAGAAPTTSPVTSATATSATKSASDKPAPAGKNPFTGTGAGADADTGKGDKTKPGTVTTAATVTAAMTPPTVWRATPGVTLKDALLDWTTREKCPSGGTWKLAWNTSVSYRIDAPLAFSGSFREALNQLFILYGAASTPLYAATQSAQCVLLVDDKEPR